LNQRRAVGWIHTDELPACHSEAWRRIQQHFRMRASYWILRFAQNDKQGFISSAALKSSPLCGK
jgi:hypothetical protein